MEALIILLFIVLIIVYVKANSNQKHSIQQLKDQLGIILDETKELRKEIRELSIRNKEATNQSMPEVKTKPVPDPKIREDIFTQKPTEKAKVYVPAQMPVEKTLPVEKALKEVAPPQHKPMHVVQESWWEKWLRNNPDIEKFIGENLINKIGIAILVLGIAFFVKYAIDKEWINETGRVCIGIFCGALLIGLSHYLRKSYRSFSSVLAGGGIAVFYFTIAFAFHQYQLISQTAAFFIMVVITGFACALAVLYDRIELAVIAAIGGFLTPFMVSTGEGNYIVLFIYLVIINAGLLTLAFFKRWPLINIIALFFTELIFGGWLVSISDNDSSVSYSLAVMFASVFYLLFIGMNIIYQVRYRKDFKPLDYSILLLLNGSYFAAGMFLLTRIEGGAFQGVFTLALGLINLILARFLFKRQGTDKKLVYLLIGLTLTFLSLTIPVQLDGHAITLFWSAEMVLLLWLYQRSRINLFFYSSLLVTGLTLISLMLDWKNVAMQETSALFLVFNNLKGLVTNIVVAIALAGYAFLLRKDESELPGVQKKILYLVCGLAAFVVAYLTAVYGINLLFRNNAGYEVPNVYHRLISEFVVITLICWQHKKKAFSQGWLLPAAFMAYLLFHIFSFPLVANLRNGVLTGVYAPVHLVFHWVSVIVLLLLLSYTISVLRKGPSIPYFSRPKTAWIISVAMVLFFSQEVGHVVISIAKTNIEYNEGQYAKAILTIVWGLCSFGLMWLGMKYKNKTLRIISLSLFCLALIKLFFFDISNVSEGGKIAAFILLGALLLTISFMYQKLRKIIIDDSKG